MRRDPVTARAEIAKHLDGDPVIMPLLAEARGKRAEIRGRRKANSLLAVNQEAAELRLLADNWLRGLDLNQRPLGYEPNELPGCSTPR